MMESIHKEGENKSLFVDFSVRKMYYYVSKQENQLWSTCKIIFLISWVFFSKLKYIYQGLAV